MEKLAIGFWGCFFGMTVLILAGAALAYSRSLHRIALNASMSGIASAFFVLAFLDALPAGSSAVEKLREVVGWTMGLKLAGEMPSLPSQNSSLRTALIANKDYMDGLMDVSDRLGAWIEAAQAQGALNPKLPSIAVLYTLYARACDPVLEFLKMGGLYTNDEIVALVLSTCFEGLETR